MKIKRLYKLEKTPIYIDKVKVGDERNFAVLISENVHNNFGNFSGDKSPIHTKKVFYNKNGYKKKLGYGFLLTSILSQIYGMYYPGGSELCLRQICDFKKPFFVGDILNIKLKIVQKNQFGNLITIQSKIIRMKKELVFIGEAILKLSLIK